MLLCCSSCTGSEFLRLYRSVMRTLRYLPDEADRAYMAGWARDEFVKHKDEKDMLVNSYLEDLEGRNDIEECVEIDSTGGKQAQMS
uniref:Complex 1 LYR protein domain-containing protein n=1 Tax=Eptatretus burgeri TaxID=7764 RepID=A0A8C4QLQ2_EPTBU